METRPFGIQFLLGQIFDEELAGMKNELTRKAILELATREDSSGYDLVTIDQTPYLFIFDHPMRLVTISQARDAEIQSALGTLNRIWNEKNTKYSDHHVFHSDTSILEDEIVNQNGYDDIGLNTNFIIQNVLNIDLKETYRYEDFIYIVMLLTQGYSSPN